MADVVIHSPLASLTCLGGTGVVDKLANSVNCLLTKLCELPESTKMSITLFCTKVLSLIEFEESAVVIVLRDS